MKLLNKIKLSYIHLHNRLHGFKTPKLIDLHSGSKTMHMNSALRAEHSEFNRYSMCSISKFVKLFDLFSIVVRS